MRFGLRSLDVVLGVMEVMRRFSAVMVVFVILVQLRPDYVPTLFDKALIVFWLTSVCFYAIDIPNDRERRMLAKAAWGVDRGD